MEDDMAVGEGDGVGYAGVGGFVGSDFACAGYLVEDVAGAHPCYRESFVGD